VGYTAGRNSIGKQTALNPPQELSINEGQIEAVGQEEIERLENQLDLIDHNYQVLLEDYALLESRHKSLKKQWDPVETVIRGDGIGIHRFLTVEPGRELEMWETQKELLGVTDDQFQEINELSKATWEKIKDFDLKNMEVIE
jgi:hypothetical protein